MLRGFILTFLPIFVAVDVVGLLPIYLAVSSWIEEEERRATALEATITAGLVGTAFLLAGDAVLTVLGVSVGDLQIAGGIVLLVLSIYDLLHPELPLRQPGARFGAVPLGIPMIVGPAVLTTLLTLARAHGYLLTLAAFAANLGIVWVTLHWATVLGRILGAVGARAVAKVSNLLLAAIGVTLIRQGIIAAVSQLKR